MKTVLRYSGYTSTVLFFVFVGVLIYAWLNSPNPRTNESGVHWSYVSLGKVHVAVTMERGGNLVLFNQKAPYTGSIYKLAGDNSVNETGLTSCGIYFRHITHTNEKGQNWWTLMVSLWYPIIIFGIFPCILIIRKLRAEPASPSQPAER